MKLLKELLALSEGVSETPYAMANKTAEKLFGEFGIMTVDEDDLDQIIFKSKADAIAKKMFGEFGFASLSEKEAEELLNKNPNLLRIKK